MTKNIINRAFFGKDNAFKINLTKDSECYFNIGRKNGDAWNWTKAKMNDLELAQISSVLEGRKDKVSFYHKFKGDKTQIWITTQDKYVFIKIESLGKRLIPAEQQVLNTLIQHCILRMNMEF